MNSVPIAERPIDRPAAVWTLLIATSIMEAVLLVLPSLLGALGDTLKLSAQQIGLLGSSDLIGIALSTASGPFWLRKVPWRTTALASLAAFLLCNAVCFGVKSFVPLMLVRLIAGLAAGVGYSISLAGVMDTKDAARNAGLLLLMQVVFSAVGVYAIDAVPNDWRLDAVYGYILIWLMPFLPFAWRYFPEDPCERDQTAVLDWRKIKLQGSLVAAGVGIYFLMTGSFWGYLEGVAREAGLTVNQTGQALSVGQIVSFIGAGLASAVGLRWGRVAPLVLSGIVQIAALYLLTRLNQFDNVVLAFYVINAAFQIMWSYIIPYFIIMFDKVEPSGRFVALYGMVTHLTLAIGPYVGAFFIVNGHHNPLLWFAIALVALCVVLSLIAVRVGQNGLLPLCRGGVGGTAVK